VVFLSSDEDELCGEKKDGIDGEEEENDELYEEVSLN
jgi:hypothetical protein